MNLHGNSCSDDIDGKNRQGSNSIYDLGFYNVDISVFSSLIFHGIFFTSFYVSFVVVIYLANNIKLSLIISHILKLNLIFHLRFIH